MDTNKIYLNISTRHHYIPRFLIDGFKNDKGLLYIFDKKKNKILSKPRPPKSIFFENKRNTVQVTKDEESSIIEDSIYSKMDDRASKIVKYYQNGSLTEIDFNGQSEAEFSFFLISLFWRIPYTDYAAKDLMNRSSIESNQIDPKIIRQDSFYQKFNRTSLFKHTIDEITKSGLKGKMNVNIHQFKEDMLVIGDNPILYRKSFQLFSEFNSIDTLFALNSRRIYSSTNEPIILKATNAMIYNAVVIDQSLNYVASGNLNLLENSIRFYNEMKTRLTRNQLQEQAFILSE